ncbi:nuclear transport factor 2 family protein [Aurantiacibacter sp. MUD61]|uniref:nuclear transport factor 2 family protein n=1 Tax=Aurantiacibacter sp. MUD61 TaxID=3009083 RepID=UPI0022F0B324|nr:nuclear transport factor 2 family protein [Aurantiacibacter sp. MUD61]
MRVWGRQSDIETLQNWVAALNARDFAAMADAMATDFRFIDSSGDEMVGREQCLAMLATLFEKAPDHKVQIDRIAHRGDDMLISGLTSASHPKHATSTHFVAQADHRHVKSWQSFSDRPTHTLQHFSSADNLQSPATSR